MSGADFNDYTDSYRELHTKNLAITGADTYFFARQKAQMIRGLETDRGSMEFLDLGCGDGQCLKFLGKLFPGSRFTGADSSGKSIEKASSLHLPGTEFIRADATNLPFDNDRFDGLLLACVLHHVEQERQSTLLSEAYRVCRPGGRIYIFEHNPWNPLTRYLVRTCPFDEGVTLLRSGKVSALLEEAGFQVTLQKFYLFFPPSRMFSWIHRLEKFLGRIPLGGQYLIVGKK